MFDFPVVFIDIETTGGGYRNSRVLEIAAIRYENGQQTAEFNSLINPETYVPQFITNITGITSNDVSDSPTFSQIADDLSKILQGAVFIAHNVNFDYSFIKAEYERLGQTFSAQKLCTVRLSRSLYSDARGHSLEKIIQRHSISVNARHRALDDTEAMIAFTKIARFEKGEEEFLSAVSRQLKTQYAPVHIEPDLLKKIEKEPGVYIFKDASGAVLYVGKSVNMYTRVLSHFRDMSAKEVKLAQATHRVETIPTGSELLALLLESRLVKRLSPVYNRQLRRMKRYALVVRHYNDEGYAFLTYEYGAPADIPKLSDIYGLYDNKIKARKWIDIEARTFDLCPKLLSLEKGTTNQPCFWVSLGKCRGACVGRESSESYNARLELAMHRTRIEQWPYNGAVTFAIDTVGGTVTIDNWIIQSINSKYSMIFTNDESAFDYDEYKIIKSFIRKSEQTGSNK